jgi:hypothetical protein
VPGISCDNTKAKMLDKEDELEAKEEGRKRSRIERGERQQTKRLISSVSTVRKVMNRPWQHTTRAKDMNRILDGGVMLILVTSHRTVMSLVRYALKVEGVVSCHIQ